MPLSVTDGSPRPVKLNISGSKYLIPSNLLTRYPDTLLGQLASATHEDILKNGYADAYLPQSREYFFCRNLSSFEVVLSLYLDDVIHKPTNMCNADFLKQLDFWRIPRSNEFLCSGCCKAVMFMEMRNNVQSPSTSLLSTVSNGTHPVPGANYGTYKTIQALIWVWVDDTNTVFGCIFTSFTLCVLFLNFVLMVVDSIGEYQYSDDCAVYFGIVTGQNYTLGEENQGSKYMDLCCVNLFITIWFTFEFAIRLAVCPKKLDFMKNYMNWCDLVSFLPFYVELTVKSTSGINFSSNAFTLPKFLRLIKVIRIFRLAKIIRHSRQLKIMSAGIQASKDSFILLVLILSFFVFGFSATLYYIEGDEKNSPFQTIPGAAWWSIATYFAYGDCPPVTSLGKFVATLGAVSGIVVLAFPIGLILDSFTATFKAQREAATTVLPAQI